MENKHINTRVFPFSSISFKMFQEDIVAALNSRSIGRLEEYESLVPNIVDTNKEIVSRVTEVNHRVVRLQQQQESRFENNESSFSNYVEQSDQQNLILFNTIQQLSKDVKILMMQQQCINSQMQLFIATNSTSILPQPSAFPVVPTAHTMQPFPFSLPDSPSPFSSQSPVPISPALPSPSTSRNPIVVSKPKPKSKKRLDWLATTQAI
jgi:hypothetical protein